MAPKVVSEIIDRVGPNNRDAGPLTKATMSASQDKGGPDGAIGALSVVGPKIRAYADA